MVPSSTIAAPLLNVDVATTGAPMVPSPSLLTPVALPVAVLVAMVLPSSSLCLPQSFVHLQ